MRKILESISLKLVRPEVSGMAEMSQDNLLRSWKEIAAYLKCDVRTCHRWEASRGLPVHRDETGETKSPVFAYKDELDRWFQKTFRTSNGSSEKESSGGRWLKWAASGGALVLVSVAALVLPRIVIRSEPADFAIDGSAFIVLDKQKRELWRRDMGVEDLQPESYYRSNFQIKHSDQANILPSLVMKDINGDGDTEVLFALARISNRTGEGTLFCYDRKGRELWRFRTDRELVCKTKVHSPDYRIGGFHTRDLDGDGRREILVESFQSPDWPCQLAVLDSSGKMIGEFWNAGYLRELKYHDINGDGREELIVCGVNNEYQGGCLIVFDTRDIRGSSPQSGDFVCEGLAPGSMLYYIRTPYVDVSEAVGFRVDGLRLLDITANNWIRATAGNGLIYDFDQELKPIQVSWGHGYMMTHSELARAGKVASRLDEDYRKSIVAGIRYWNGSAWTPEPSKVRR